MLSKNTNKRNRGFTLVEILVALFIFAILSTILVGALHHVINAQDGAEKSADRLRQTQMALLLMSRDIKQAVYRPITNSSAKAEAAFIGLSKSFTLTHTGYANSAALAIGSALQRTRYQWEGGAISRMTWPALDLAADTLTQSKKILTDVESVHFYYLDKDNHFHESWPLTGVNDQPLPRAVKVELTITAWGKLSQLFIIPARHYHA